MARACSRGEFQPYKEKTGMQRRMSAATVSSCNRRKREREAGDISGNADRYGRVRRDRRWSLGKIRCGAHAGTRRKGPRRRDLPSFRATVALGQDSASERPVPCQWVNAASLPKPTMAESRESRML